MKAKKKSVAKAPYNEFGLIRTIEENEEIDNNDDSGSEEDSDQEGPKIVSSNKKSADFDANFAFEEQFHQSNTWEQLKKRSRQQDKTSGPKTVPIISLTVPEEDKSLPEETKKLKDVLREKKNKTKAFKAVLDKSDVIVEEEDLHMFSSEDISFQAMNLSRPLQKAISAMNYVHPTRIQASTVPVALLGRDIYACAATGTGKTAAFMLPVLERLLYKPKSKPVTRVLVLVPTRELAVQVFQVSQQLAQFSKVEIALATGGLDVKTQEAALRRIPDVVIATPGRLIDHLQNAPNFNLQNIEILILDEADRMLDEFFASQMKEVIAQCSFKRQTMLFSATMTEEVKDLAAVSLRDPAKLFMNSNTDVAWNLRQEFVRIRPQKEGDREAVLAALICRTFGQRTMVFAQTKKQVHRLNLVLKNMDVLSVELHGNLNQAKRLESLRAFQEEEVNVMVATDVAARGLDIKDVKTVINFTMPNTIQHYIHRVGRTARAGKGGRAVSLVGESERKMLKDILKKTQNVIKQRVISLEVISQYQTVINQLESKLKETLDEEVLNEQYDAMEAQLNKAERIANKEGVSEPKRSWFQTHKEREKEKEAMTLNPIVKTRSKVRKGKKGNSNDPDERVNRELQKTALFQARQAKRQGKPKRIRVLNEGRGPKDKSGIKRKSSFEDELVNTKRQNVKKFRHMGNKAGAAKKRKS